jgi:predicted nucleotidyltransferase
MRHFEEISGFNLNGLLKEASSDMDVLAVILFGSVARGESNSLSDADICIVLIPKKYDHIELSHIKLKYSSIADFDINIFQQLPLYIRHRVLKEGRILFCKDEELLYSIALRAAKDFEDFRHIYRDYLEVIAHA